MISNGKLTFLLDREDTSEALLYQTKPRFENIIPYDRDHWMVLCDQRADYPFMRDVSVQVNGQSKKCSISLFNIHHGIFRQSEMEPTRSVPKFSLKTREFRMYKEIMFTHIYFGLKKGIVLDDPNKYNEVRVLFEHEKQNMFDIVSMVSLSSITGEAAVQIGRIDKQTFWCAHDMGVKTVIDFDSTDTTVLSSVIKYSFIRLRNNLNWG